MAGSTGPAIRGVVRVLNQNSCGSGSVCGHYNGGSLILTNAHVAGTRIGRRVQIDVESTGERKTATVIRAAYSNQVVADWALLFVENWQEIEPTLLSKKPPTPGESFYTKGFPRCRAHNGTDITQHRILNNGVALWLPDAIGGQSGSGVWSDPPVNLQKMLLTWSWTDRGRSYGAGQLTSEIYKQNRSRQIVGFAKMPGLVELNDYDLAGLDMGGVEDDLEINEGFHGAIESGIQDFPIWAEDVQPPTDPDDPEPTPDKTRDQLAEFFRDLGEMADKYKALFEGSSPTNGGDPGDDDLFGL